MGIAGLSDLCPPLLKRRFYPDVHAFFHFHKAQRVAAEDHFSNIVLEEPLFILACIVLRQRGLAEAFAHAVSLCYAIAEAAPELSRCRCLG